MRDFNEEAFQVFLGQNPNKGLELINQHNPAKAREIFNFYAQLNE